ncbi:hypothetical protein LZ198_13690 [Myxococcus sp. K15C18031901]|uniref:hypothetical protein n=1 Tax=Myxococcus dinghuensis TaxID=2906761 RepID=UPI0020A78DDE|nr:hypothetical protein [Myxococcus dinghuensis]MCP3099923.1 hypothetical protein [Myxococcus dinghuensis]
MQTAEIKDAVLQILMEQPERFYSAYQICQRLEVDHPNLWKRLVADYPSTHPSTPMGEGTGNQYSPASFVANALAQFVREKVAGLTQETLDAAGVSFGTTVPGFTGKYVGIWAFKTPTV